MNLKSRKLWFTIAALIIGTVVDLKTERGLSDNLRQLLLYLAGLYVFGNNLSAGVFAFKEKSKVKDTTVDALVNDMGLLQANQRALEQAAVQTNRALETLLKQ